ncbi:MAG TPA: hypothetical protein VI168_16325 [Croceibacterium sp.]
MAPHACDHARMAQIRLALTLVALAAATAAVPAQACSAPRSDRPTNLALAAEADAIVLGQVVDGTAARSMQPSITVHPVAAIKGLLPGQDFALRGVTLTEGLEASDPLELEAPHPDALSGSCARTRFTKGSTVLFFLDRRDGEWVAAPYGPYTRWAEEVPGEDAPWVQLTSFYTRLADLPDERRRAVMEAERDALRERDEPAALAIAADLERELAAPPLAAAEPQDDGFYEPGEVSTVQRALDQMRADRDDP